MYVCIYIYIIVICLSIDMPMIFGHLTSSFGSSPRSPGSTLQLLRRRRFCWRRCEECCPKAMDWAVHHLWASRFVFKLGTYKYITYIYMYVYVYIYI